MGILVWKAIMIIDDFIEFFIGGNIQEPVAIEIPLEKGKDSARTELVDFLRGYGLTIDTRDGNLQSISVTGETKRFNKQYFSIITPALNPEDLIKTYTILKELLEKFNSDKKKKRIEIMYPHVLDLNNLVTQKQSSSTGTDIIKRCIENAEKSGNVIKCKNIRDLQEGIYAKDPDSKNGYIFGGSAMSDSYTVATTMYARYFRYASSDVRGAAPYSGVFNFEKKYVDNNFCNVLPNGNRVGFLHQYKKRPDQLLFRDQSIEGGTGVSSQQETMVNRFNNPVAATYVLWQDSNGDICAFKIPDSDADWAAFKEYYAASFYEKDNVKREKIAAWKKEGEKHKAYTADEIFGSDWEERLKKAKEEEEERKRLEKAKEEAEKEREKAIKEQLSHISNGIKGVSTYVESPRFDAQYDISYGKKYDEIYEYYKKFINKSEECIEKYNGFIAELDTYQKELDSLKENCQNCLDFYQGEIDEKKKDIHKKITSLKEDITSKEEKQKQVIEQMAMVPNAISDRLDMDCKGRILDFAILKHVSLPLEEEKAKKLAGVIFNIYNSLSAEEKGMLQEKFEKIKNKSSKQVLKQLKQIGKDKKNDEFRSLFEIQKSLKDIFKAGIKKMFNLETMETVRRKESANSRR